MFNIGEFLRLLVLAHVQERDLLMKIIDLSLESEQFVIAEDSKRLLGYIFACCLAIVVFIIYTATSDS